MPSNPLTEIDRAQIFVGIKLGMNDSEIAEVVGRCRSTVNREIDRNGGRNQYCPERAQRRADRCRRRPKVSKLEADPVLCAHVRGRLEALDSPKRISIEISQGLYPGVATISHETIYKSIQTRGAGPLGKGAHKFLHRRRRSRKRRTNPPDTNPLGIYCSIRDLPQQAVERSEVGHLEGDLIVGAHNKSALITLFDRMTRYLWLLTVASKSADAVYHSLSSFLATVPPGVIKTLSWDQGAEIARHRELALATRIGIHIADPKSPWQRPTNEAGNALVRRYVGKGTDLNAFGPTDLEYIAGRINTIPRPTLNWNTAHKAYHQELSR